MTPPLGINVAVRDQTTELSHWLWGQFHVIFFLGGDDFFLHSEKIAEQSTFILLKVICTEFARFSLGWI